jgi:hypothetical protein
MWNRSTHKGPALFLFGDLKVFLGYMSLMIPGFGFERSSFLLVSSNPLFLY